MQELISIYIDSLLCCFAGKPKRSKGCCIACCFARRSNPCSAWVSQRSKNPTNPSVAKQGTQGIYIDKYIKIDTMQKDAIRIRRRSKDCYHNCYQYINIKIEDMQRKLRLALRSNARIRCFASSHLLASHLRLAKRIRCEGFASSHLRIF